METKKNNIINKSKQSTKVVIVDKFEDNPQLEGKEMQFHKKPEPIKPPGPKDPKKQLTLRELIIEVRDRFEASINDLKTRVTTIEDILQRNNLR